MCPKTRSALDPDQGRPVANGFPLDGPAVLERQDLGQRVLGQRHRIRLRRPQIYPGAPGPAHPERGYSKRIVEGAVILRSSGSVSRMIPKAATRPMPMIV